MITIKRLTNHTALYQRYPTEQKPQPCFVEFDCRTGELSAEYDAEIGSMVPRDVHHGHRQRWTIPALTADAANALLDEIAPLAERVMAGYEQVWDGSNHVAKLSDDAVRASEQIEQICDAAGGDGAEVMVWAASDYFDALGSREAQARELGITAQSSDEELDAIAMREIEQTRANDVDEIEDLDVYLQGLRDAARKAAAEQAKAEHGKPVKVVVIGHGKLEGIDTGATEERNLVLANAMGLDVGDMVVGWWCIVVARAAVTDEQLETNDAVLAYADVPADSPALAEWVREGAD